MKYFKPVPGFIMLMSILSSCEMFEGAGEDVEDVGEKIQDAAQ